MLSASTFRQQIWRINPKSISHRYVSFDDFAIKRHSTTYPRPNHSSCPKAGSSVLVSAGLPVRLPRPKRSGPSGFAPVRWLLAKNLLGASPASSFVPLCALFVPLFACSSVVSRFRSSVLSWLLVPRSALCPPRDPLRSLRALSANCARRFGECASGGAYASVGSARWAAGAFGKLSGARHSCICLCRCRATLFCRPLFGVLRSSSCCRSKVGFFPLPSLGRSSARHASSLRVRCPRRSFVA